MTSDSSLHQCVTVVTHKRPACHAASVTEPHTYCPLPQVVSDSPTTLHQPTKSQIGTTHHTTHYAFLHQNMTTVSRSL